MGWAGNVDFLAGNGDLLDEYWCTKQNELVFLRNLTTGL